MKIFPRYLLRPRLLGENRVYNLLASLPDDGSFAVHSLNLPEHAYKRWSEADFVIVSRRGVTLLEVKGGTVSLVERVWQYKNARGQAITSTEGPAWQALSAASALEKMLTKALSRRVRCRWGVVFPLSPFHTKLPELPATRLADVHTCSQPDLFARWLDDLPGWSDADALLPEEIQELRDVLVPEFTASASLGVAVRSAEEQAIRLTSQQYGVLESLATNPRLAVSGGAGTGKTELAVLCALAEKAAGRHPAIVTPEGAVGRALRSRLAQDRIPVVARVLPRGTDTLVVDEGQDYAQPESMRNLFAQLPGGVAAGRWRWFMDPNLQFAEHPPDPACVRLLQDSSAEVRLSRNVRSTREIVGAIRGLLAADVGISEIDGLGIRVGFHAVQSVREELDCVERLLVDLLEDGVHPREIAVLGANGGSGPVCSQIARRLPAIVGGLSADDDLATHGVACGIGAFRGLEAKAVILTDLGLLQPSVHSEAQLYIGMSRASALLHLTVAPAFRRYMAELVAGPAEREKE